MIWIQIYEALSIRPTVRCLNISNLRTKRVAIMARVLREPKDLIFFFANKGAFLSPKPPPTLEARAWTGFPALTRSIPRATSGLTTQFTLSINAPDQKANTYYRR
jgi:hypothetical protein